MLRCHRQSCFFTFGECSEILNEQILQSLELLPFPMSAINGFSGNIYLGAKGQLKVVLE